MKVQTLLSAKCTVSIRGTHYPECPFSEWVSNGLHVYSDLSVLLNTQNALQHKSFTHTYWWLSLLCKMPLAHLFTQTLKHKWHNHQHLLNSCLSQGHISIQTDRESDRTTDLLVSGQLVPHLVPQLAHVTGAFSRKQYLMF